LRCLDFLFAVTSAKKSSKHLLDLDCDPQVLRAVALYIDLNPVRAGLVEDPKDYWWCGYVEAVKINSLT
jgi:hypothetical protein